ncbi:MAG: hypothetical protein ABSF62_03350 [Bryobacteraceae bacterium]
MTRWWVLLLGLGMLPAARAADPMLFVYFKEPANMGVFFAISDDGYHFHPLNGGKPWFGIEHAGALIRDPFITRGPDGQFHMVWTWGWHGQSIGYAHSADLVHWSEQRELPLMAGIPGTNNTWAPETYWDEGKSQWLIIWSSTVAGRQQGNRIYSAWTADFREGPGARWCRLPALYFPEPECHSASPGALSRSAPFCRQRRIGRRRAIRSWCAATPAPWRSVIST